MGLPAPLSLGPATGVTEGLRPGPSWDGAGGKACRGGGCVRAALPEPPHTVNEPAQRQAGPLLSELEGRAGATTPPAAGGAAGGHGMGLPGPPVRSFCMATQGGHCSWSLCEVAL